MLALSFYLTLPIFNVLGMKYFQDAWIFNKFSILIVFFVFIINLNSIIKKNIIPLLIAFLLVTTALFFSYLIQTWHGYAVNIKTNNTHILLMTLLLFYFCYKSTIFDLSLYIFKPIFVVSALLAFAYLFIPNLIRELSLYSTNLIGINSIFVDREFRFSSVFSEPSKLAIFSGIAFFYYMDRNEKLMSAISLTFLILSMSKFAIVFVPVCIILSLLLRRVALTGRVVLIFTFITSYIIFLLAYSHWLNYLYSIVSYESLNTYETRFGFPIIALSNIISIPLGVGIFDGYRYVMLNGDFTIASYCNELINSGGNCYEMSSYSLNSLAEFFPKDILSTLIFYYGFIGVLLIYIYGYYVTTKMSNACYYYTPLYIFLCLLFVTSYDYMIIVLALMVIGVKKDCNNTWGRVC